MKNNGKVCDVRSMACNIKVLNGRVPGTWKWTIVCEILYLDNDFGKIRRVEVEDTDPLKTLHACKRIVSITATLT